MIKRDDRKCQATRERDDEAREQGADDARALLFGALLRRGEFQACGSREARQRILQWC